MKKQNKKHKVEFVIPNEEEDVVLDDVTPVKDVFIKPEELVVSNGTAEELMAEIEGVPEELEKDYDFHPVSAMTEIKAGFFGKEDEMIVAYIKKQPNYRGATLSALILYFCYRYAMISQRRLMNRLKHLIRMKFLTTHKEAGVVFYKVVIDEE